MKNRRSAGFSVIELLIAAGIFLIIAVGLLPLFITAIRNNLAGREATDVSNMGKSRLEEYFQLSFDDARLDVPGGTTEFFVSDFYQLDTSGHGGAWTTAAPSGSAIYPWTRITRVRQYNLNDLREPLDGDADPGVVHLKEVQVDIVSRRTLGNPLGVGRPLMLRVYKAK